MKTLYESILDSDEKVTKDIHKSSLISLIKNPIGKEKEINKLWKAAGLSLDFGDGEGYWSENYKCDRLIYYVPKIDKDGKLELISTALLKVDIGADILIFNREDKRREIRKWITKICKVLHMTEMGYKNYIYLDF